MLERIDAVQRMQDYIEAHLNELITPADLARASLFSPWYAARLFQEQTGLAPADYIRRLRLSRSAARLREGHYRITDAAFDMGFGSVEGYSRAFKRMFGCLPGEYAKNPVPIHLFIPYGVKFREMKKEKQTMGNVRSVFISQIEKPARKAIIKRGVTAEEYWTYCEEVGCDVWGLLTSMPSISGEPVCMWLPDSFIVPGTSKYVQGVEIAADDAASLPEGFDLIDLPACSYLMFQGEPFEEEDFCEAIEALRTAIERYDPAVIGLRFDQTSPRIQLEPIGKRGYIELLPVKPAK